MQVKPKVTHWSRPDSQTKESHMSRIQVEWVSYLSYSSIIPRVESIATQPQPIPYTYVNAFSGFSTSLAFSASSLACQPTKTEEIAKEFVKAHS